MLCIIKVIIIAVIVLNVAAFIFARYYRVERRADVVHFLTTPDGWKIALHQYRARPQKGRKKRLPVLLCHGLSSNHLNWDISERLSMSRSLAAAGYEVFAVDLRASGMSDYPGWFTGRDWNFDFFSYLDYDITTAIDAVLDITGEQKLHYVAHSMGGMLAYSFLQTPMAKKIKSCAILASPSRLDQYKPALKLWSFIKFFPVFHLGLFSKFGAPFSEVISPLAKVIGNYKLPKGYSAVAMANTVENIPMKLMANFVKWTEDDAIAFADGTEVVPGFKKIRTPTMFMVGSADLTCIAESVQEAYEAFGSKKKELHMMGPEYGHLLPYGHQAVQFGTNADIEVYPVIIQWIEKN